jgi:peroxiredoxin
MKVSANLIIAVLLCTTSIVRAEHKTAPLTDPTILLVRDNAVREELACTAEQCESLDDLLRKHNRMLLAIRDVSPSGADASAQPALKEIRAALAELLTKDQKLRLQGLTLQAQGYDALLRKDMISALKLTAEQQTRLAAIHGEFQAAAQELQKGGDEQVAQKLQQLQAERHKQIVEVLTTEQETELGKLLGTPFDFTKVVKSPAWAPEFEGIEEWINSEPLTMASLRGKVVVVHFFAFGCSNCINNYPWYREWNDAFQGQDVALIGIHTPETKAEEDNKLLRDSLEHHKLKFPVAVDKGKKMWTSWYNGIWPSVYIVDRQGRVRYWWYGELDWQGAGNQKVARKQIEELLVETKSP